MLLITRNFYLTQSTDCCYVLWSVDMFLLNEYDDDEM